MTDDSISAYLTPSKEEQIVLILSSKCPHNRGWRYVGYEHNNDCYECKLCGEYKWH